MDSIDLPGTDMRSSRFALGTWPIGGAMWGGSDEKESICTIHKALECGFTCIDTADDYGFGKAEETVGKAVKQAGLRDKILLSDKCALNWTSDQQLYRDGSRKRILEEAENALRHLQTDYIDLYHVHWPDPSTPMQETAQAMQELRDSGKIRAVGVSNFTPDQINEFEQICRADVIQPPYNLFERGIEEELIPFLEDRDVTVMTFSALCRGMLSTSSLDDKQQDIFVRSADPKWQEPRLTQYRSALHMLEDFARDNYGKHVVHLALRWLIDREETHLPIWAARHPEQLDVVTELWNFSLDDAAMKEIDRILLDTIKDPIGPESFMAPPLRNELEQ
ncbi:aldo/keto reductase [Phytohalomonas tamaricis]|uniref:aldo/keto reductase n=1 Tax=Phytohalomonas tamaricis TaxID=2081032 RepID=UPI000D0BBB4F|nr:aldo/keto reductase [Phytohalomonas tamaricis]